MGFDYWFREGCVEYTNENGHAEKDYLSEDVTLRLGALYKKINISRFSESHSVSRKQLYKMRDEGLVPRYLLLLMCEEAKLNPVFVEFSPKERLKLFSWLCTYVKTAKVENLIGSDLSEDHYKPDSPLSLLVGMYQDGYISDLVFETKKEEILGKSNI